jgi:hypothetical protein
MLIVKGKENSSVVMREMQRRCGLCVGVQDTEERGREESPEERDTTGRRAKAKYGSGGKGGDEA